MQKGGSIADALVRYSRSAFEFEGSALKVWLDKIFVAKAEENKPPETISEEFGPLPIFVEARLSFASDGAWKTHVAETFQRHLLQTNFASKKCSCYPMSEGYPQEFCFTLSIFALHGLRVVRIVA